MTDTQVDTRVGEVLAELAALEDPRAREVNERHGDDHGVNLTKLRGVAKALNASMPASGMTQTGTAIGTPAYMAPEQLAGDPAAIPRFVHGDGPAGRSVHR